MMDRPLLMESPGFNKLWDAPMVPKGLQFTLGIWGMVPGSTDSRCAHQWWVPMGGIIVMPVAKDGGDNVWGPEGGGETGKVWRGPSSPLHFAGQTLSAQPTVTAKVTGGSPRHFAGQAPGCLAAPLPAGAKVPREPSGPGHFAGAAPTPPGSGTGGGKPLSRPTAALTPAALLAEPSFCYNFERIGLKLNNKNANPQTSRVEYQESVSWAGNFGSGDPEFSSSIPPPAALMEIERTTLMGYSVWASGREMGGEPTPKNEPIAATALSAFPNLQGPPSPPPGADVKGCRSAHP